MITNLGTPSLPSDVATVKHVTNALAGISSGGSTTWAGLTKPQWLDQFAWDTDSGHVTIGSELCGFDGTATLGTALRPWAESYFAETTIDKITDDVDMVDRYITNMRTPTDADLDYAANVQYVQNYAASNAKSELVRRTNERLSGLVNFETHETWVNDTSFIFNAIMRIDQPDSLDHLLVTDVKMRLTVTWYDAIASQAIGFANYRTETSDHELGVIAISNGAFWSIKDKTVIIQTLVSDSSKDRRFVSIKYTPIITGVMTPDGSAHNIVPNYTTYRLAALDASSNIVYTYTAVSKVRSPVISTIVS